MPNTEVKLLGAENTYELPCWEDRKLPVFYFINYGKSHKRNSSIAQLVDAKTVRTKVSYSVSNAIGERERRKE